MLGVCEFIGCVYVKGILIFSLKWYFCIELERFGNNIIWYRIGK